MKSIVIILSLLTFSNVYPTELVDIQKLENDVTLIRFTEQFNYSTSLSADKKNLTIDLPNTSKILNKSNVKLRSNIQKEIFVTNNDNSLKLSLLLNKPSGFNSYKLPYSNSLVIENFDWSELDKSEESYRDGLFAYESMLYDIAIEHLSNSTTTSQSKGILGLIYLFQDSIKMSYKLLVDAARNNSYLPDVYAALSQIHFQNGDTTKAKYYNQRFLDKLSVKDSTFDYPKLIFNTDDLDINNFVEIVDSSDAQITENMENDKRFSNLFDTATSKSNKEIETGKGVNIGSSTTDMKSYAIYLIIAFILIILLVVAYYMKWRNIRLNKQKELARSSFENELNKERSSSNPSPIVYDKTIGINKKKESKSIKENILEIEKKSNFNLQSIEEKISYKEIIENIRLDNESNIKLDSIQKLNDSSKSKLFRKYFVNNK